MAEYTIESTGHGEDGRYYELEDNNEFEGITVNELDGTITLHES